MSGIIWQMVKRPLRKLLKNLVLVYRPILLLIVKNILAAAPRN